MKVAFALLALLLPVQAFAIEGTVRVLREAGPPENRVDLLVVGEGYTAQEQMQLAEDAERLIDGLFTYEPWKSLAPLFNVRVLEVVSNESGADGGEEGGLRDTAFGARYGCNGVDRLLCVDEFAVLQAAAEYAPETDYVFVLVNDPKYGGSGGVVAVASLHPMALLILVHEVGHQVAQLADEYEEDYPGYPACSQELDCPERNVTLRTTLAELKWASWVEEGMPIPSPRGMAGVGLFEGARYRSTGVYRPEDDCLMHSAARDAFCKVCEESHVLSFLETVDLIDEVAPAEVPPFSSCDEELAFHVRTIEGIEGVEVTWSLGGEVVARDERELRIARRALPEGASELVLQVELRTDKVRDDPDGVLVETRTFVVEGGACGDPCRGPFRCEGGRCDLEPLEDGAACGPGVCVDGEVRAHVCEAGACVEREGSCGAYACDEAGAACRTACEVDADCAGGASCDDGACVPPKKKKKRDGGCSAAGGGAAAFGVVLVVAALRRRRFAAG